MYSLHIRVETYDGLNMENYVHESEIFLCA